MPVSGSKVTFLEIKGKFGDIASEKLRLVIKFIKGPILAVRMMLFAWDL